jgi:hypothetical protein
MQRKWQEEQRVKELEVKTLMAQEIGKVRKAE